jgi:hypothetical protein
MSSLNLVPRRSLTPPPSRKQLLLQALTAAVAFTGGVIWADRLGSGSGGSRAAATLAALLIIGGLCGAIVTSIQHFATRR